VVRGVAGAACPAAAGVGAFVQVVFDDLAQKIADFVFSGGIGIRGFGGGGVHSD